MSTPQLPDPWPPEATRGPVAEQKATCRSLLRAERRRLRTEGGEPARRRTAARLREHGTAWLAGRRGGGELAGLVVTSYEPFPTEPDVSELNAALVASGATVLVPVTLGEGRLDWQDLADPGRGRLGRDALARVEAALVPALAVTREGLRLGKGGGYYDRAIPLLPPGAATVAVLHAHEVVGWLPAEAHDRRVSHVLTPDGVRPLG